MKKNSVLSLAVLVCQVLAGLLILCFLVLTGYLVFWHINPNFFSEVSFNEIVSHDTAFVTLNLVDSTASSGGAERFLLNEVLLGTIYLSFLQISAVLLFSYLALKEFLKVLRSVNGIQTFQKQNVQSFRRIGKYLLFIFILSSFKLIFGEETSFYGFYLHITPLLFMLLAFVMAEVFKEGNNLYEENLYTV